MINNEVIVSRRGNCYIGPLGHKMLYTGVPKVFQLDPSEKYFVMEYLNGEWITRAGQSTRENALRYMDENRVLLYRKEGN